MRGPGSVEGNFAIESALDELSYQLEIDPIQLRPLKYAEVHPQSGLPWSSKAAILQNRTKVAAVVTDSAALRDESYGAC